MPLREVVERWVQVTPKQGLRAARWLALRGSLPAVPHHPLLLPPPAPRRVAGLAGGHPSQVRAALDDLLAEGGFWRHLESVLPRAKGVLEASVLLYLLCRLRLPEVVVETGVASGVSSAFVLLALRHNGTGRLLSIDLPDHDEAWVTPLLADRGEVPGRPEVDNRVPSGETSGWVVPASLRDRWDLVRGDTRVELPAWLDRLGVVDLALHDSDHSAEAVVREGSLLGEHLRPGGLLLVDDVDVSEGFEVLRACLPWKAAVVIDRLGILKK